MTITFFLRVSDTGSWLEIGQTLSFFCIASLLLVWSAGVCALGALLARGVRVLAYVGVNDFVCNWVRPRSAVSSLVDVGAEA